MVLMDALNALSVEDAPPALAEAVESLLAMMGVGP
jgi:hypothetical protein